MDVYSEAFLKLWRHLNENHVRYIMVGGFATNFHGYQRFTGDIDIYLEDTAVNRQNLRKTFIDLELGDFEALERIEFVPGWVDFQLENGVKLDIMTSLKGVDITFDECLKIAPVAEIEGLKIPFLHINQLIDNKRSVARPKDLMDVSELEQIRKLREAGQKK